MYCSADAVCNNAEGSYNCSCKPGYYGDGWSCKGSKMKQCILNLGPHKLWYSVLSIQCQENKINATDITIDPLIMSIQILTNVLNKITAAVISVHIQATLNLLPELWAKLCCKDACLNKTSPFKMQNCLLSVILFGCSHFPSKCLCMLKFVWIQREYEELHMQSQFELQPGKEAALVRAMKSSR